MYEVVNKTDNNFDTADNDDGNDDKKKSANNLDKSVERVETNSHVWNNIKPTTVDPLLVFIGVVKANSPTIAFLIGVLFFFVMVAMNDAVLFIQPEK